MEGLHLIIGPMYSGKTTKLLAYFQQYTGEVIAFKPAMDNRYETNMICSHDGEKMRANVLTNLSEIRVEDIHEKVVLFDEVQFFDENLIQTIEQLINAGKLVAACGLDLDYKRQPFILVEKLKQLANDLVVLKATCHVCGQEAPFTYLKTPELIQGQLLVGGEEIYEARCSQCHEQ